MMIFSRLNPFKKRYSHPKRDYALPPGVRIYAIGDIHGKAEVLAKLLTRIEQDAQDFEGNLLIQLFLGDYVDRGEQSCEVVEQLLQTPPKGHDRICLMGNHEATLLDFLNDPTIIRPWLQYGGMATLDSYGVSLPQTLSGEDLQTLHQEFQAALPDSHRQFFHSLRPCYQQGDYFFVHAGIDPKQPLEEQSFDTFLWIRDDFLNHPGFYEHYIVHGHTPVPSPQILESRANLDLSIAEGKQLGCLKLEGNRRQDFSCTLND